MRRGLVLVLSAGLGFAAAWSALRRESAESVPVPPRVASQATPRPEVTPPAIPPAGEPAGQPAPPIDPDRRRLAQPDGPGAPGSLPERIAYPIAAKYAHEELSRVPHRVIGAWDARPEQEARADLRVFILVVDPATSDAALEELLRDAAARHRDCTYLRVQVFDSEAAARLPSWIDAGAARAEHLVAELVRMPDATLAGLEVRGRRLER
jgi:hypothetical protein